MNCSRHILFFHKHTCGRRVHGRAHRVVAAASKIEQLAEQLVSTCVDQEPHLKSATLQGKPPKILFCGRAAAPLKWRAKLSRVFCTLAELPHTTMIALTKLGQASSLGATTPRPSEQPRNESANSPLRAKMIGTSSGSWHKSRNQRRKTCAERRDQTNTNRIAMVTTLRLCDFHVQLVD